MMSHLFPQFSLRQLFLPILFLIFQAELAAQAPANDICSAAVALTSAATCNSQTGTTVGSSQSLAPITCNAFTSTAAKDVWYSFTAFSAGDSVIVVPTGTFDPIIQLFSGTCSTLLNLACADAGGASRTEKLAVGTLTAGQVYYLRVYGWGGADGQFSICIKRPGTTPQSPVNDNCSAAIGLPSGTNCGTQVYSSANATQSLAPASCSGFTSSSARDVWFSFAAGTAGDSVILRPSGTFDGVLQLFSGTCTAPISLICSDNSGSAAEKLSPGNLVAGQTYLVRVYGWAGSTGSFTLCVKQPGPSTPDNDNCEAAFNLVSALTCASQIFSNTNATQSLAPAVCNGSTSTSAPDVWFNFSAVTASDTVIVSPVGGFNPVVEIFSGPCSTTVSLACSNSAVSAAATEKVSTGNLIPGTQYFIRVYGFNGVQGQFAICVKQKAPDAPGNDNCSAAVTLTSSATCNPQAGTTVSSSQSQAPITCNAFTSTSAKDVWYNFTAFGAGDSVIVVSTGTFDPIVQLFSGTCSTLVSLACADATAASGTEKIAIGTLTSGQVYFVRVYGWNGADGQFSICVKRASSPPLPPANDNCSSAIFILPSTTCGGPLYSSAGATQSLAPVNCNGATSSSAPDVWFSFVASGTGDSVIVAPLGIFDPIVELFSGTCTSTVSLGCSDNPSLAAAVEKISPGNLVAGTTYRVRVYGWNGGTGQFSFCIKQQVINPPANDNCSAAISLSSALTCNAQTFSTLNATQSRPPSACGGITSTSAQDVWFQFGPAITQGDSVIVTPIGNFNPVVEVFSGLCTNLTSIGCSNNAFNPGATEKVSPGNLNLSMIYYVRVYGYNGSSGQFSICVKARTTANLTNDDCNSAITLNVNTVCSPTSGTNVGSTQSLPAANCNGSTSTSAPDVWYKFTAVTAFDTIYVLSIGTFDAVVQLYSGTCSNLQSIACSDGPNASDIEKVATGNLIPGQTYYFRVYGWNGVQGDFGVCIKSASGGCTTIPGTFSTNTTSTVANSIIILNLSGGTPGSAVQWQISVDNVNWSNAGTPVFQVADTFYLTATTSATYYLRAIATAGSCLPGISNSVAVQVACATTITNKEPAISGIGISNVSFAGINNTSTSVVPSGAYQNFRNISGNVCRGSSYPLSITPIQSFTSSRAVWIDYNNNGDFSDFGENVVFPTSGNGNFTTSISIPSTASIGTVRMRVMNFDPGTSSPTANPCFAGPYASGEIEEYSLNISSAPTTANAGSNTFSCSPTVTLSGNIPSSGTGTWTVISGSAIITNPNSPTATATNLSAGPNVFQWTIANACSSSSAQVTITYNGGSVVANAGLDQSICGGQANLSANTPSVGTGLWTIVSGSGVFANPASANTLVTGLGSGANVFRWTISNPPCNPAFDEVQITNIGGTAVVAQAGADQTICQGTASLNGNNAGAGTGLWTLIAGSGTIQNPSSPTSSVSSLGQGTNVFRWTITTGNCPPSTDDVSIIRQASPSSALAGPDQIICSGQTQLAANEPVVGSGVWTLVSGSGLIADPLNPGTTVTGLSNGVNVFRWTVTNGICPSVSEDVIVSTNLSAVAANAGPDQVICSPEGGLAANEPGNGTGQWTLVSGTGIISNPSSPVTTVSGLGNGNNVFRWTITSPGCNPSSDDVVLYRNFPALAAAGPNQQLCTGQTNLSATLPSTGTGVWSLISGSGTIENPSNPASLITGLGNGQNVFRWTVSNPPCQPVSDDVVISTNLSAVAANAGPDQSICGFTVIMAGNNPGSGTGVWAVVQGSGNFVDPASPTTTITGMATGTNIFSWTINPGGACSPSVDLVTIEVSGGGVTASAGTDQTVCGSSATLSGNNPGTGSGIWTRISGSGDVVNPTLPNSPVINLGAGNNVFRWTINNSPCPSSSDEVSITSTPSGLQAGAGPDQTVCGSTASLNAVAPVSGSGVWTLVSGSGTPGQTSSPVSSVSGLSPGANVFLWTVTSGACSASDAVTITLEPDMLNLGEDTLLCTGASLTLNAGGNYASYLWSDNSTGPALTVSAAGLYWLRVVSPNNCVFSDTIRVILIPCTGVESSVSGNEGIQVYPNPSEGVFRVLNQLPGSQDTEYRVFSSGGKEVLFQRGDKPDENGTVEINLRGKPSGLYLLESRNREGRRLTKLLLK
jgi:hypothetical protein